MSVRTLLAALTFGALLSVSALAQTPAFGPGNGPVSLSTGVVGVLPPKNGGSGARTLSTALTIFGTGSSHIAYSDLNSYGSYSGGIITPTTPCSSNCNTNIDGGFLTMLSAYTDNRVYRAPNTQNWGVFSAPLEAIGVGTTYFSQLMGAIAVAPAPVIVVESGGPDNSIILGDNCPTMTALDDARNLQFLQAGAIVIEETIFPRGGGSAFTTTQAQVASCYNNHIIAMQAQPGWQGFYVSRLDGVMSNAANTSGWTPATYGGNSVLADNVHCSATGCSKKAWVAAQIINALYPATPTPWVNYLDVFNATNNVKGNKLPNGALAGTSGTVSGVGASGTAPNSTTLSCAFCNGLLAAGSVGSALPDGTTPFVVTLSGTAASGSFLLIKQNLSASSIVGSGEVVEGVAWVNLANMSNIEKVSVGYEVVGQGNYGGASQLSTPLPAQWDCGSGCFVPIQTPLRTTGSETTGDLAIYITAAGAGAVTGTVTLRGARVYEPAP